MKSNIVHVALAGAVVLLPVTPSFADTINLNNYLTAFAPGNVAASGQPWVVAQGTGAVITVASPPAPGTNVAQVSGDTRLRDVLSINWLAGQEYTLDLWLLVPSGNVIGSPSVSLGFVPLGGGVGQDGLSNITNVGTGNKCTVNGTACSGASFSLTGGLVAGQWKEFAIDFTTPSGLSSAPGNAGGRPITIDLVACCQGISNQLTDWFISPAPVPAPLAGAGLPGLLAGFGAILGWYRKRRAATA